MAILAQVRGCFSVAQSWLLLLPLFPGPLRLCAVAAMEPTPDELKSLSTIEDVAGWVPWRSSTLKPVLNGLGVEMADPPCIVAALAEGIVLEAAGKYYDSTRPLDQGAAGANKLTDADASRLKVLWDTSRLKCGLTKSQLETKELDKDVMRPRQDRGYVA